MLKLTEKYVDFSHFLYKRGFGERWRPGNPLKLFLTTYSGVRNTGADIRVQETVRQINHLLGNEHCQQTVMTFNLQNTYGYFSPAHQKEVGFIYPLWVFQTLRAFHGVIASEGSMFKSQFTNVLPTFLIGSMGFPNSEDKLSVAYGVEAGHMCEELWKYAKKMTQNGLVICRNHESEEILQKKNIRTYPGTDTALTFISKESSYGKNVLKKAGWDGKQKILAIAAINPFCWPVYPSLSKGIAHSIFGTCNEYHYKSIYFFSHSKERDQKFQHYLDSIVEGSKQAIAKYNLFPILIGMEALDKSVIIKLSEKMGNIPTFSSQDYDMFELVSILRESSLLLSSRFHAVYCTLSSGIPSAGISMDVRLKHLFENRGHSHLLADVHDPDLAHKIPLMLENLMQEKEKIQSDITSYTVNQLQLLGMMGIKFCEELLRVYPQFPLKKMPSTWREALPELSSEIKILLQK